MVLIHEMDSLHEFPDSEMEVIEMEPPISL